MSVRQQSKHELVAAQRERYRGARRADKGGGAALGLARGDWRAGPARSAGRDRGAAGAFGLERFLAGSRPFSSPAANERPKPAR